MNVQTKRNLKVNLCFWILSLVRRISRVGRLSLIGTLVIIVAACRPYTATPYIPTQIPSQLSTLSPTAMPTVSATAPTNTVETHTQTPPSTSNISKQCLSFASSQNINQMTSGSLVYQTRSTDNATWIFSSTAIKPQKLDFNPNVLYVSPYSGSLVWLENSGMFIRQASGKELKYSLQGKWQGIRQWLPDDGLIIDILPQNPKGYYATPVVATDEFFLLSSPLQIPEYHSVVLAGFFATGVFSSNWRSTPIYSPDLTRALYDSFRDGTSTSDQGMILWDVPHRIELWSQWNWGWPLEQTSVNWDLSGNQVVITAPSLETNAPYPPELITVSSAGKATQLTYLSQDKNNGDYLLWDTKWSPDDKYVAFVFNPGIDPQHNRWLYLVNTKTGSITDYCFDSVSVGSGLFWSPNSKQLAFASGDRELIVLDIETGEAQKLVTLESPNTLRLNGWVSWTLGQ